jgi:lysyl endopeptidase
MKYLKLEVNLSPENSGEWFEGENGYRVWKITIRSLGAFSLNLIFDEFELPANARLFLYNEKENHQLGAFTQNNNVKSRKFAVAPVAGDEITVQYEIPETLQQVFPFKIIQVNHDYVGILKSGGRRPVKLAGACNIDINCDDWKGWEEIKNSVCRIIIGSEVCSGVLVNNTNENQKPYVLSAAHCYDKWSYPEISIYTFNYESPFCAPLDGDPLNTLSGAVMKAQFDSLDFALVELNTVPQPDFRPYYAGWNRSANLPASTVSIHHPQGDIKKLANDLQAPVIASYGEAGSIDKKYVKNAFWWIKNWEKGTTEAGSSGGPLFGDDKLLRGTLTGGEATCSKSVNDYFNRFSMSWDFKSDSAKQLKYWLDPIKSGVQSLNGKQFNRNENLCGAFTNLNDNDEYSSIPMLSSNKFAGYWGGSNSLGITEIMERFSIEGNEILSGVSLGVGKFKNKVSNINSSITIKVYNGSQKPEDLIYTQVLNTYGLAQDAMNFVKFSEDIKPSDIFFVGFELSNIQPLDSFAVYQSLRTANELNTFYFKQNGSWYNFKEANPEGKTMANIFELVACNIDDFNTDTPLVDNPKDILVFPNPSNSRVTVEAGQDILYDQLAVFNLLGQRIEVNFSRLNQRKVEIDLTGNVPGVYFVRFDTGEEIISRKISFVPW